MAGESPIGGGPLGGGAPPSGASTPAELVLASPGLTLTQLQYAAKALLTEWLEWWFDGTTKELGGETVQFPHCAIVWDQHEVTAQPLATDVNDLTTETREIACHIQPRRNRDCTTVDANRRQKDIEASIEFIVRTQTGDAGGSNFDATAIADLLFAICDHPDARLPLAVKGLLSMAASPAFPVMSDHYKLRVMRCRVTFQLQVWNEGNE